MKRLLSWTILIQFHIVKLLHLIVPRPAHILMEFCDGDDTLLEELLEERNYLQTCYEEMSKKGLVEDWYYHSTMDTTVDNTRFHLLGINYLSRYCYNDYN